MSAKPRVLVVTPSSWDMSQLGKWQHEYDFLYLAKNFSGRTQFFNLLKLNPLKFVQHAVEKYRGNVDAVIGTSDYPGCLLAAAIAEELKLPFVKTNVILRLSHKYWVREMIEKVAPRMNPKFVFVDPENLQDRDLFFPIFVKPIKANMSFMAHYCHDQAELAKKFSIGFFKRMILRLLLRPYQVLVQDRGLTLPDANQFIGETPLTGVQVTVEGYVMNGKAVILGTTDSNMYSGTNSFESFTFPSRLPADIVRQMETSAVQLIEQTGFDHSLFNMEFFFDKENGKIHLIEINPRMAYQFADLYEKVLGVNSFRIQLDLALGKKPSPALSLPTSKVAGSFVLRRFKEAKVLRVPSAEQIRTLEKKYPGLLITTFFKAGDLLSSQFQDPGSYRYLILNIGAEDMQALRILRDIIVSQLDFQFADSE